MMAAVPVEREQELNYRVRLEAIKLATPADPNYDRQRQTNEVLELNAGIQRQINVFGAAISGLRRVQLEVLEVIGVEFGPED